MPTNKDVFSRHQHFLEQYANGQVKQFAPFLRRIVASLKDELLKTNTVFSETRIKAKLDFIEGLVSGEMNAYTVQFQEAAKEMAIAEAGFAQATIAQGVAVSTVLPSDAQLWSAVNSRPFDNRLLKESLNDLTVKHTRRVRNAVSEGFYEGRATPEIVRSIVGSRNLQYKDGVLNLTRNDTEYLVRTALNHTASTAREAFFEANEDLIPYYEIVATLDGKTSDICAKLDGKIYKVGNGRIPPFHGRCRTTTAPVFADEVNKSTMEKLDAGGKRASMDGPVSADLDYPKWFENQSEDFKLKRLGQTKYKLYKDGDLPITKFVNNLDETLTIEQLKQTYPSSWAKADL